MKYSAASYPSADGGDLELEFHQLWIEKLKENIVGALAVDLGELEIFVVKALLNAGLGGLFAHLVVFVGRAFHVVHRRILRTIRLGTSICVRPTSFAQAMRSS